MNAKATSHETMPSPGFHFRLFLFQANKPEDGGEEAHVARECITEENRTAGQASSSGWTFTGPHWGCDSGYEGLPC